MPLLWLCLHEQGLVAAFPKLVGSGTKQHTFVETDNCRCVHGFPRVNVATDLAVVTALLYLAMSWPMALVSRWLERRLERTGAVRQP